MAATVRLLLLTAAASAQYPGLDGMPPDMDDMDGMPSLPKKEKELDYPPLNKDIPYIRCSVCQKMAEKAYQSVQRLVAKAKDEPPPKKKLKQFEHDPRMGKLQGEIEEVMDRLCDVESDEGKWMSETDIYKRGDVLVLDHVRPGTCRRECRTMQKACQQVVESIDSDMPKALHDAALAGQSVGMAKQRVCNKLSKVCKKGNTPPYKGVRKNEEFWPFTDAELKMEMTKRLFDNNPKFQQVNNPVRKGKKSRDDDVDDLDSLHDEV